VSSNVVPFNPLDKKNLGNTVANAMLAGQVHPLEEVPAFSGAGIYAIYYTGGFPAYRLLADRNRDGAFGAPIYVGKAIPQGGRKGVEVAQQTTALSRRLREHADSIKAASNLDISDFSCRYLVVDDIWIPLGESLLIARFSPVWNTLIDGFGNHDPGKGRHKGMRPRWDVLHPGRSWADRLAERPSTETAEKIAADVETFLRTATFGSPASST
jgi:hypothetical protein